MNVALSQGGDENSAKKRSPIRGVEFARIYLIEEWQSISVAVRVRGLSPTPYIGGSTLGGREKSGVSEFES
jgi:hypothetical protein